MKVSNIIFLSKSPNFRIHILVIILIQNVSCIDSKNVFNIEENFSTTNRLQVQIAFSTSKPIRPYIEYWLKGDSSTIQSSASGLGKTHTIELLYLKADTVYQYIVKNEDQPLSSIRTFETLSLPESLPKFVFVKNQGDVFSGKILLRKTANPGYQLMLNENGDIVWYQESESALYRPFNLTGEDSYISLKDGGEIVELSFGGDTLLNLHFGDNDFDRKLHHEILKSDDGLIVALTDEYKVFDLTRWGGSKQDTVNGDGIIVLDREGKKQWSWSIFDVYDPVKDPRIKDFVKDWGHANSLAIAADSNYIISFRHFDQIWKIDKASGNIVWKLGINGDFPLDSSMQFYQQHNGHINSMGDLLIFDNGTRERKYSRAVSFKLNEIDLVAEQLISVNLPENLFSFKQGSASLVLDSMILFSSPATSNIVLSNMSGEILWQVKSDYAFYRAVYVTE